MSFYCRLPVVEKCLKKCLNAVHTYNFTYLMSNVLSMQKTMIQMWLKELAYLRMVCKFNVSMKFMLQDSTCQISQYQTSKQNSMPSTYFDGYKMLLSLLPKKKMLSFNATLPVGKYFMYCT